MHMLSAQPGGFNDEPGIIDLQQSPGEVVILAAADGTLGLLTRRGRPTAPGQLAQPDP